MHSLSCAPGTGRYGHAYGAQMRSCSWPCTPGLSLNALNDLAFTQTRTHVPCERDVVGDQRGSPPNRITAANPSTELAAFDEFLVIRALAIGGQADGDTVDLAARGPRLPRDWTYDDRECSQRPRRKASARVPL
jgi:hypothetical protein